MPENLLASRREMVFHAGFGTQKAKRRVFTLSCYALVPYGVV